MGTEAVAQLQEDVRRIKQSLWEEEPSLMTRMTKLEVSMAMMTKVAWLMLSASLVSLFTVIGDILSKHLK